MPEKTCSYRPDRSAQVPQQISRSYKQASIFRTDQTQNRHQPVADERYGNQALKALQWDLMKTEH
jgi:hypothetical protein